MNSAILMLTSAWMAGADPVPTVIGEQATPVSPTPAVISSGSSCGTGGSASSFSGGCATACDTGCGHLQASPSCGNSCRTSWFSRLNFRLYWPGRCRSSCATSTCNTPAPVYHAPVSTCQSAPVAHVASHSCGTPTVRIGLFSRLRARLCGTGCNAGYSTGCTSGCNTGCNSGYASGHAIAQPGCSSGHAVAQPGYNPSVGHGQVIPSDSHPYVLPSGSGTVTPIEVIPNPKEGGVKPKEMPKDAPKDGGKGSTTNLRNGAITTPVVNPQPSNELNGPRNPF